MHTNLQITWFCLLGLLFAGYAILDGFDLGVGMLHLFVKSDADRRMLLNSIGPVWDGNEVWLVTGGGALFAAFPYVYASLFSGFYMVFMLLLVALIFRAVAIEFRSKEPMGWWRQLWDVSFSIGSLLATVLLGAFVGNLARGVPLDASENYAGTLLGLLNPYALMVAVTTVALFAMHGSIYLVMKTEGDLQTRIRGWVNRAIIFFIICYGITTLATLLYVRHMTFEMRKHPVFFVLAVANMLAIANVPREIHHGRMFRAFASSSASIAALLGLLAVGLFPHLVYATNIESRSLTIYNASSSGHTLGIMLLIALAGMPVVVGYTIYIYWVFRGKVQLDPHSY